MNPYSISKSFTWKGTITDKVKAVMRTFGLTVDRLEQVKVNHNLSIKINEGDVIYITGPSGSGKSVLLKELEKLVPSTEKINLAKIKLDPNKSVIDCIEGDFLQSMRLLSIAGLNDVFCVLNQPINLSEGQQYRFRLAAALAAGKKYIFADEFCSTLDRITATVIAYNIRKLCDELFIKNFKITVFDSRNIYGIQLAVCLNNEYPILNNEC